jgi:hypothetical protein
VIRRRSTSSIPKPKGPHPGELLDLLALSPEGQALNQEGQIVQWFEVQRVVNPLVIDDDESQKVSRKFAKVVGHVPAGENLQLYVQAMPLGIEDVIHDELVHNTDAIAAAGEQGVPDLAIALDRLHGAVEHSLATHSRTVAAKRLRHIVICPFQPDRGDALFRSARKPRPAKGPVLMTESALGQAQDDAADYADGIRVQLELGGLPVRQLDGYEVLDLLWQRLSPDAADDRQPPPSVTHRRVVAPLDEATTPEEARECVCALRRAICQETIDFSDRERMKIGMSVEQTIYLSGIPEETWLGWLLYLMKVGIPFSLSVHVESTDRYREKLRNNRRFKRLRGVNRGKAQRGQHVEIEDEEREAEAEVLKRKLFRQAGAGIYKVSVSLSLRHPGGDVKALAAQVDSVSREISTDMDGHMSPGLFAQRALYQSSLPLGRDVAKRQRRYVTTNVGDTFPLVGTGPGSPEGIPLGYAHPGRTLERLDPYSPDHPNHIMVINGRSGTGKTMTTILLLIRAMARGATGFIIDRAGHFAFLCLLIPGALHLRVGGAEGEVSINPWDVEDPAKVPRKKVAFLVALHALLIGTTDSSDTFGLDPLERSQLSAAIRDVYKRSDLTGETPRERALQEVLYSRAKEEVEAGAHEIAAVLRSLAERLHDFVGDGAYSYLTDADTTVPDNAPLIAFDTKDIPDEVAPAALFIIAEAVISRIEAKRRGGLLGRLQGLVTGRRWTERHFLVLDEAWKLVERPATGRMVMEWGKRSRHLALWLIAITQQMEDLNNQYGRALLANATMRLFLNQEKKELDYVKDALALSEQAIESIEGLTTSKREYSTAYLMNGKHGQGIVTIQVSDYEYWIATNDPVRDEPLRQLAFRQALHEQGQDVDDFEPGELSDLIAHYSLGNGEAGGADYNTAWRALQLLADPEWNREQQSDTSLQRAA